MRGRVSPSMHHRPLTTLSSPLVQQYDACRRREVHHHARIHWERTVDEEQRATQEGSDHAASVGLDE